MSQELETLPVAYQGNLIGQYIRTVSEYIKFSRKSGQGWEHEARKSELENSMQKMERAIEYMQTNTIRLPRYYFIKFNRALNKIDLSKTVYICSHGRKVIFVYNTGKKYETYAKLGDIWNNISRLLPCFGRIAQRYIINFLFADKFTNSNISVGKQQFHVTEKYRSDIYMRVSSLQYSGIEWIDDKYFLRQQAFS